MFPQELAYFPMRKKYTKAKNKENKQTKTTPRPNKQASKQCSKPSSCFTRCIFAYFRTQHLTAMKKTKSPKERAI